MALLGQVSGAGVLLAFRMSCATGTGCSSLTQVFPNPCGLLQVTSGVLGAAPLFVCLSLC